MQVSAATLYNRYPDVFECAQEVAEFNFRGVNRPLNILSFGCSSGEEVKTLHELYFPSATITGVDIHRKSVV